MKYLKQLNTALENGLSKMIFDHVRNYLMCSLLLAIGITELKQPTSLFFGLVPGLYSGTGVIGLSCMLFCLNLYDGIRKISQSKYHLVFTLGLIALYVFISLRVIELAWDFRATS
jgi:hypothetical protein